MRSFSEYLYGESAPSEREPISKTVDEKHQKKVELKLLSASSEMRSLYERWREIALMSTHRNYAFPRNIEISEIKDMQSSLMKLASDLEGIADDISAGPASAWNYQ
jgi:hypothetical protein